MSLRTYNVCFADGVEVGCVFCVLQVGQSRAEGIINSLSAVVVPLHIQQVGDHMDGCQGAEVRRVTPRFLPILVTFMSSLKKKQPGNPDDALKVKIASNL